MARRRQCALERENIMTQPEENEISNIVDLYKTE